MNMYALLANKATLNLNQGVRENKDNAKLRNLQIEIQDKIRKISEFNPRSCYDFSDLEPDETDSIFTGLRSTIRTTDPSPLIPYKRGIIEPSIVPNLRHLRTSFLAKEESMVKVIFTSKKFIKYIDIISSFLVLLGCILAQIEQELFYYHNIVDRVGVVSLMREIDRRKGNVSLVNLTQFNISWVNNQTFVDEIDFTNFKSIPIFLTIPDECQDLRIAILIFTIIAIPLVVLTSYIEFKRNYVFKKNFQISFIKSDYFLSMLIELIIVIPIQYPGIKSYFIEYELGNYLCMPYSSILSAISFIRFYYIFRLFKHLTKWTSTLAETICEKHICTANTNFALKAFQKEHPFIILMVIFITTCICFGLSLRTFELMYWEIHDLSLPNHQNWIYPWNAMWCIFVSMMTVGYGDFYPRTQVGRFITIFACIIGVYFVSMMMVFITQLSSLNQTEKKSFKLISRLKLRKQIQESRAFIVYSALQIASNRRKMESCKITMKKFNLQTSYEKRNVTMRVEEIKEKLKEIDTFQSRNLQEDLHDISERIESDINSIKEEVESLRFINEIIMKYSDCLFEIQKHLKKNLYSTKLLYNIIERRPMFGKLNYVNMDLKNLFEPELDEKEYTIGFGVLHLNSDVKEYDANLDKGDDVNLWDLGVTPNQVAEYFDFVIKKNQTKKSYDFYSRSRKTVNFIERINSTIVSNKKNIKAKSATQRHKYKKFRKLAIEKDISLFQLGS